MKIIVNDDWQKDYEYHLSHAAGADFDSEFSPELTPKQMLELGVFSGMYFADKPDEFPKDWFKKAKLANSGEPEPSLNYYEVHASQPLEVWQKKGWIYPDDPRGWFQWYARYYLGRRLETEDARQIKRWKAMKRHLSQIKKYCREGDLECRRRQRQALLHWAYDSRKL